MTDILGTSEVRFSPTQASNAIRESLESVSDNAIGVVANHPVVAQTMLNFWTDGVRGIVCSALSAGAAEVWNFKKRVGHGS